VVERYLAATLGSGAVSHLEYAMRMLVIPAVLFEGALVPMLLAHWTEQVTTGKVEVGRREVLSIVLRGFGVAAVMGLLLAAVAPQFVHLLLGHGQFSSSDGIAVTSVLRLLALAFVANMTAQLLERHYIAATRNRLLAGLSLGRSFIRLGLALALLSRLGLRAFPIGFAVSDWCYVAALVYLIRPARLVGTQRVPI